MNEQNEAGEVFDDDIITFENSPMRQCISGFGRNAVEAICEAFDIQDYEGQEVNAADVTRYHIDELVHWCRAFNREKHDLTAKCAELEAEVKRLREALTAAQGLIAHSPGCNERYYGRDQTCCCGFYECKRDIRAALTPPNNQEGANGN